MCSEDLNSYRCFIVIELGVAGLDRTLDCLLSDKVLCLRVSSSPSKQNAGRVGGEGGIGEEIKGNPGHIGGQHSNTQPRLATSPGMFSRAVQGKSGPPRQLVES